MPELAVSGMSVSNGEDMPELQIPGTCKEKCTPDAQDCSKEVSSDTSGRTKLRSWLNKQMRIEMSDGRILVGIFLCTDRDGNVILGSCTEYISPEAWGFSDEPRMLGLVMVPGKHIVTVHHDSSLSTYPCQDSTDPPQTTSSAPQQSQSTSAQTQTHIRV